MNETNRGKEKKQCAKYLQLTEGKRTMPWTKTSDWKEKEHLLRETLK